VFNDSYNLSASSGIAGILNLDPDRHVSCIVQSCQVTTSLVQNRSKEGMVRCVNLRLTAGMAPNRTTTAGVSEALKERVERSRSPWRITSRNGLSQFLMKKDVRGRMFFLGEACGSKKRWKKVKAVTSVML
jgi:hypothetical protein